ncbi:TIR domain-containing protein [Saccharothrix deserti]|uniref:TIR domain-containing protein n=1 Tax=Saccharothrix deserti TaxID=2593674 RepID=UPI00131E9C47|nr:TIR domain-containing protein [Saccharothrix deserti]
MTIFVSYTRADETLVRALRDDLGRMGQQVWLDHEIRGGELWWREILETIRSARVFVFALSKASWKSLPCHAEFDYAQQLGLPVLPVQVGPLDNLRIPIMERQIVDYRERSADAIVSLAGALAELTARPLVLPNPLPPPPKVPFEYLYRIAELLGPRPITPERQEIIIGQLRRHLRTEQDEVARADIIKLLREFRERGEITNMNSREIDEILSKVEQGEVEVAAGATWLPAADYWRQAQAAAGPQSAPEQADSEQAESEWGQPQQVEREQAEPQQVAPKEPEEPGEAERALGQPERAEPTPVAKTVQPGRETPPRARGAMPPPARSTNTGPGPGPGTAPLWLRRVMADAGQPTVEKPNVVPPTTRLPATPSAGSRPSTGPSSSSGPPPTSPSTSPWWQGSKPEPEKPEPERPVPHPPPSDKRPLAFVAAVLGATGIPFLLLSMIDIPDTPEVVGITATTGLAALVGLVLGVVAARRDEPRSRHAVVIASIGLLGVIICVAALSG